MAQGGVIRQLLASLTSIELNRLHQTIDVAFQHDAIIDDGRYFIDHLVTVDKKGKDNSVRALWRIGRHLHQHHYDILINLHPNERTSFLAAVIHAKQFVGMSHFLVRPLMDRYTRLDRIHLHAADMYINVLAQLGIDDYRSDGLQFFTCKAWDDKATEFYRTQGVHNSDALIGFNIGSAVPQKRWPAKRFAAVADYFARRGFKCVFFGGPMDEAMVKEATSQMESDPIIATGKFTIGELASAIRCCSLFITNDSGPMHVAVSQSISDIIQNSVKSEAKRS